MPQSPINTNVSLKSEMGKLTTKKNSTKTELGQLKNESISMKEFLEKTDEASNLQERNDIPKCENMICFHESKNLSCNCLIF